MLNHGQYRRPEPPLSEKPRRVRGGVRLRAKQRPLELGWVARRWMAAVESATTEHDLTIGFEYARSGQARGLEIEPGRITANVQGRAIRPYRVAIQVPTFTEAQWEQVVAVMSDQAIFGARLLSGDVPEATVDLFASLGLKLFPDTDITTACTAPNEHHWCKHAACAGLLVAEALDRNPHLIFTLRGLPAVELLERLRDRRASLTAAAASAPPPPTDPTTSSTAAPGVAPLEASIEDFWEAGPELRTLETPLRKPEVAHALLRRLGPSPFTESRFPLVGLLATCYDSISRAALELDPVPGEAPSQESPEGT